MLGNVSQACKVMGYSRDSFYRFQQLYETGGEPALRGCKPKPAEFVQLVKIGGYSHSIPAKMASEWENVRMKSITVKYRKDGFLLLVMMFRPSNLENCCFCQLAPLYC
jgi:Winged helix-turn helix